MRKPVPETLPATQADDDLGPALKALKPQYRLFVLALCTNGGIVAEAAREAGFVDNGNGSIRVTGHRIFQRPDVKAAVREVMLARLSAGLPAYVDELEKIAKNPQHKDQAKALFGLLDRGGLPAVVEKNVNITVTLTNEEKLARLRELASMAGVPEEQALGMVDLGPSEYREVKPEEDEQW